MVTQVDKKQPNVLRSIDWITVILYLCLMAMGWISVCGASYTYGETDILSFGSRSGMQIVWIGTAIILASCIMLIDSRLFEAYAYPIFCVLLLLLFVTIFNPHQIKGSRSWLVLGPLRLQPAEFAKFATALGIARFMSTYGFNIHKWKDLLGACAFIFVPMICIVLQKETGSALVYLSFFLMLYREGMSGSVLIAAVAAVVYFVVGIRFEEVLIWDGVSSLGKFAVLLLVQIFTTSMVYVFCKDLMTTIRIAIYTLVATIVALLVSVFIYPFNIEWVQLAICVFTILYLLYMGLSTRIRPYFFMSVFVLGSLVSFYMSDYALNNILEPHQRTRINVLLGLDEDLRGAGYNVHQSEIAIGSGGLEGKGFLNGTQTKLKFVPEQDTDFIFCTVGEEEGFLGSAGVLILFLCLILRLIHLAERQPYTFGRVYGYCVLSVFLFHVFINVGMVLGLTPVIGIPLPFFSYGGSSLWGFTILLFIFLRIDANRALK